MAHFDCTPTAKQFNAKLLRYMNEVECSRWRINYGILWNKQSTNKPGSDIWLELFEFALAQKLHGHVSFAIVLQLPLGFGHLFVVGSKPDSPGRLVFNISGER